MKIERYHDGLRYTLSNDNLKVGDKVYPIANGRCLDGGGWILHGFDFGEWSSFPQDPHTILNLKHSDYKPYEIRTDHGFGPVEKYYKIIKVEERIVEYYEPGIHILKLKKRDEWIEKTLG